MRNASISAIGILNASAQLTLRVASPWMGVLWITALPHRLMQFYFIWQFRILDEPHLYAGYLTRLAMFVMLTFAISLYGRAVYVRACHIATHTQNDSKLNAFKVPLSDLVPYLYMASINELFFYLTSFTMFMWPLFVIFGGLAAATSYDIRGPKFLAAPFNAIKAGAAAFKALIAISCVFLFGQFMALINLFIFIIVFLVLCGPILGPALPRWEYIFQAENVIFPKHPLTYALLLIGAAQVIEPFWLAANVDLVKRVRARS